ncbi:MAG: hypothetical protein U0228_19160 [Myxococcaceae bacterium]
MRWLAVALVASACVEPPIGPVATFTTDGCPATTATLDFGEVAPPLALTQRVRIGNQRGVVLSVKVDPVALPFSAQNPSDFQLPPDTERDLTFVFAPTDARAYTGSARVTFGNSGCAPLVVSLSGQGKGGLQFPPVLDFGPVPLHQSTTRAIPFTNAGRAPITFVPRSTVPGFVVPPGAITIAPQASVMLEVSVAPDTPGKLEGSLALEGDGIGGSVSLRCARGLPKLEALAPISIAHLPAATQGPIMLVRDVVLRNTGEGELTLSSATVTPGPGSAPTELRVAELPATVPAGGQGVMRLQLTGSTQPGPRSFTVTVLTDEPGRERVDVAVSAQVEEIAPCFQKLEVTGSSIAVGPPYPRDVVVPVHNSNPGRCLLDDLRLRSNQFGWTLTPPGDQLFVEAGQTVTLTIGITAPGVDVLQFATAASPFGYSLVPLNALP